MGRLRAKWLAEGTPWRSDGAQKPLNWNPMEQLARVAPEPPLHSAARHGDLSKIEKLLESGPAIDINARDIVGFTALLLAVWRGQKDVVELLLAQGADPNVAMPDGSTALGAAMDFGLKDIDAVLRAYGAVAADWEP